MIEDDAKIYDPDYYQADPCPDCASLKKALEEKDKKIADLEDFAIWMTGCGYDFCQHEYFCKKRDELLKGAKNG